MIFILLMVAIAVRTLLPEIDRLRPQVEQLVSGVAGRPLRIGRLDAHWEGWDIVLRMTDVQLLSEDLQVTLVALRDTHLRIDPWASLQRGVIWPGNFTVVGAKVSVTRKSDGTFTARGITASPVVAQSPPSSAGDRDEFTDWLLSQNHLSLESATIIWTDQSRPDSELTLTDVSLLIGLQNGLHHLEGTASLPAALGERITFGIDISGDPRTAEWSGNTQIAARQINLASILARQRPDAEYQLQGVADLSVRGEWSKARLIRGHGGFRLTDGVFVHPRARATIALVDGKYEVLRIDGGWKLSLDNVNLETEAGAWPTTQVQVSYLYSPTKNPTRHRFEGMLSHLRLKDVLPFITIAAPAAAFEQLQTQEPDAQLLGTTVVLETEHDKLVSIELTSTLEELSFPAREEVPGIAGLGGTLRLDSHSGSFVLATEPITISAPKLFPQPLTMMPTSGAISWRRRGTGWWFDLDSIAVEHPQLRELTLGGAIHWPYQNRLPIVNLNLKATQADLVFVSQYAPIRRFNTGFALWLARAAKSGQLHDLDIHYQGYGGDFPFAGAEGSLTASATMSDTSLAYAEHWPEIIDVAGVIDIHDATLHVSDVTGTIYGSTIKTANAEITGLNQIDPSLNLNVLVHGESEAGMEFLKTGPLASRFANTASNMTAHGRIDLDLNIKVALPRGDKQVTGTLLFEDTKISLQRGAASLEGVSGPLSFNASGLSSEAITANYLGNPVQIKMAPHPTKAGFTRILVTGRADREFLVRQLHKAALFADPSAPPRVLSQLHGETGWDARLDVPLVTTAQAQTTLVVHSDLMGLESQLPSPFRKSTDDIRELEVRTTFSEGSQRTVQIEYGRTIDSIFELQGDDTGFVLQRGSIEFGGSPAALSTDNGLRVGGLLKEFSIDAWTDVMRGESESSGEVPSEYPILAVLNKVELQADRVDFLGNQFPNTELRASKNTEQRWVLTVVGPALAGDVTFPKPNEKHAVVEVDLDRLSISVPNEAQRNRKFDPQAVPALRFTCDNLTVKERPIGALTLSTTPSDHGMRIDTLRIASSGYTATGNGVWQAAPSQETTSLQTHIHSQDLAQFFASLGFDRNVASGGETDLQLNLVWPGPPSEFSLRAAKGTVQVSSNDGRLLDVDPGAAGRMFGFLLMTSLPRRLKLDFSDLFGEGIEYDSIKGSFAVENGHAYTNNLTLENSTATITISGRTGMIDEDYDQVITVTPKLASSLPLAPIWLIEKVLDKAVFDQAFKFEYLVTGTWKEPIVERKMIKSQDKSVIR